MTQNSAKKIGEDSPEAKSERPEQTAETGSGGLVDHLKKVKEGLELRESLDHQMFQKIMNLRQEVDTSMEAIDMDQEEVVSKLNSYSDDLYELMTQIEKEKRVDLGEVYTMLQQFQDEAFMIVQWHEKRKLELTEDRKRLIDLEKQETQTRRRIADLSTQFLGKFRNKKELASSGQKAKKLNLEIEELKNQIEEARGELSEVNVTMLSLGKNEKKLVRSISVTYFDQTVRDHKLNIENALEGAWLEYSQSLQEHAVLPTLGKFTDQKKAEIMEWVREFMDLAFSKSVHAQTPEENKRFQELQRELANLYQTHGLYDLGEILNSLSYARGAKVTVSDWLDLMATYSAGKKAEQLSTKILDTLKGDRLKEDVGRKVEQMKIRRDLIPGNITAFEVRGKRGHHWNTLAPSLVESGLVAEDEVAEFTGLVLNSLNNENLMDERGDPSMAMPTMRALGRPEALDMFLQYAFREKRGDTISTAVYQIALLGRELPEDVLQKYLVTLPEEKQKVIKILVDEDSYLNQIASPRNMIRFPKAIVYNEEICEELKEKHNWTKDELSAFYHLSGGKEEVLVKLVGIAKKLGLDKTELIRAHIERLFEDFDPDDADHVIFFNKICNELGLRREDLFFDIINDAGNKPNGVLMKLMANPENGDFLEFPKMVMAHKNYFEEEPGLEESLNNVYQDPAVLKDEAGRSELLGIIISWPAKLIQGLLEKYDFQKKGQLDFVRKIIEYYNFADNLSKNGSREDEWTVSEIESAIYNSSDYSEVLKKIEKSLKQVAQKDSTSFIRFGGKEVWKLVFGEQKVEEFLDVLPKKSNEKRNAFTHNDYDRTSQFMSNIFGGYEPTVELDQESFDISIEYVKRFGLSKTKIIFEYYRNIVLHEQKGIDLPEEQVAQGITNVEELEKRLDKIKQLLYSEDTIGELEEYNTFETEILRLMTGKSTHRFDSGRPRMEKIIEDWNSDFSAGEITELPAGYEVIEVSVPRIRLEVNVEKVQADFELLRAEIFEASENPKDITGLKSKAEVRIREKLKELQEILVKKPDNKYIKMQYSNYEKILADVQAAQDLDALLIPLLSVDRRFASKSEIYPVLRQIILKKLFTVNFSPETLENLISGLEGEVTAQGVLNIINIVDNFIKDHVINTQKKNEEGYWTEEAWKQITGAKDNSKLVDVSKLFKSQVDPLRAEVANFSKVETGAPLDVKLIPDRGFVGEMAGYIADVCYTAEYPLLKTYPNVVPYKFVVKDELGDAEFIGSVLMFELEDRNGDKVLLVRGFDVPGEADLDINYLIEKFLDQMQEVAVKRGAKKVIVPGVSGTISNYSMTIAHITKYSREPNKNVTLSEPFAFNGKVGGGYDLTESCYIAREVK